MRKYGGSSSIKKNLNQKGIMSHETDAGDEQGSPPKSGQMCCIEQAITGVRSALPGELVVG